HSSEGEYDITEQAIQQALAERAYRMGSSTSMATSTVNIPQMDLSTIGSPETYFCSNRNEDLGNGTQGQSGSQQLSIPQSLNANSLYLGGTWDIEPEYA